MRQMPLDLFDMSRWTFFDSRTTTEISRSQGFRRRLPQPLPKTNVHRGSDSKNWKPLKEVTVLKTAMLNRWHRWNFWRTFAAIVLGPELSVNHYDCHLQHPGRGPHPMPTIQLVWYWVVCHLKFHENLRCETHFFPPGNRRPDFLGIIKGSLWLRKNKYGDCFPGTGALRFPW